MNLPTFSGIILQFADITRQCLNYLQHLLSEQSVLNKNVVKKLQQTLAFSLNKIRKYKSR